MVHKSDYTDDGIPLVNPTNIKGQHIVAENICKVTQTKYEELSAYVLSENDIVLARRGDLSKCAIVNKEHRGWLAGTGSFFLHILGVSLDFFIMLYTSPYAQDYLIGDSVGTTMNNLNQGLLSRMLIPIPPLFEQSRILEHYRFIMPIIEQYTVAYSERKALDNVLPLQIKKSVLQEAIQGKLVPQNPKEESASLLLQHIKEEKKRLVKEGKLKKKDVIDSTIFRGDDNKYFEKNSKNTVCIDEEIPFEIPDTWVWVRLDDICEYIQRGKSPKYSPIKKYPVIAQKCNQWSGFSIEKAQFIVPETISSYGEERKLQDGDLLWNSTGLGTLGRMAIYYSKLNPYELAVADSHVTVIRTLKKFVSSEFLYAYFSSYTVQSVIEDKSDGSTKQKELATNTVKAYLVPLPPYEEQKRIVNRIDEVFAHLT